ncbi:hypothetical protein B0T24DRAFT_89638 [Lasiosphaeria ovina]|uniref:Uncharacterized protein n=1 Tax=Lasiosphaeria ovina TaxID=92902 RepID=A0AAE0NN25_9PEZI|nr:hypothetical protein B0T24DRAFT_89638 [Lasiosphaeria ovina]
MPSLEERERIRALARPRTRAEIDEINRASRLSLPPTVRIPIASGLSFLVGLSLGTTQGSTIAGLRFRAEHAHKLPTSSPGWYLYHKSKNYHVAAGGLREGLRMGAKISFWTTAMVAIESMFDTYRETADLFNTVTACVTVAGGFSLWNCFSLPMAARTTKTALVVGFLYGGMQDFAGVARGRPIGYVDTLNRTFGHRSKETSENISGRTA